MASNPGRFRGLESPARVPMKITRPDLVKAREQAAEKFVYLNVLAEYMGRTHTGLNYLAKRNGIKIHLVRGGGHPRPTSAVTAQDAKRLIELDTKKAEIISPAELMKG